MKDTETNKGTVLFAVTCTETDPSCTLCPEPCSLAVLGLFPDETSAVGCANRVLVSRRKKIADYYEDLCGKTAEESAAVIAELTATETEEERSIKQYILEQLRKQEQQYRTAMVPDLLVVNDEEGRLCEITARDESIDWTCCIEIKPMQVGKDYTA